MDELYSKFNATLRKSPTSFVLDEIRKLSKDRLPQRSPSWRSKSDTSAENGEKKMYIVHIVDDSIDYFAFERFEN